MISLTNGLSSVKSTVLKGCISRSIDVLRIYLFSFSLSKNLLPSNLSDTTARSISLYSLASPLAYEPNR
jgi:hypothetical protein